MPKKRDTLTLKQRKLIDGLTDNYRGKNTLPFRDIAKKAGYSHVSASNPPAILKSKAVQKRLSAVLATIEKAREVHLAELFDPKKVSDGSLRDHAYVYDILVKNQQLLSGKATENTAISIQISEALASKYDENPQ